MGLVCQFSSLIDIHFKRKHKYRKEKLRSVPKQQDTETMIYAKHKISLYMESLITEIG